MRSLLVIVFTSLLLFQTFAIQPGGKFWVNTWRLLCCFLTSGNNEAW